MQYNYYSEGNVYYRDGVRNGSYVIDTTLTAAGFGGAEGVGWINVYKFTY